MTTNVTGGRQLLDVAHNPWLVAASLAVALMAGFTGLSLTKNASELSVERRKANVVLSAIALGGGIWSMHFVAMLGMELPIDFYYDPLITLISALTAILLVGLALLLLHFKQRTNITITCAGGIVGVGILAMHYIGMSGIQRCLPLYSITGTLISITSSIILSIAAIWLAYGARTHKNIILGTLFFGIAVFAVHFVAMSGTSFIEVQLEAAADRLIDNDTLAFLVTIGVFILCGGFLLNGATFWDNKKQNPTITTMHGAAPFVAAVPSTDAHTTNHSGLVPAPPMAEGIKQMPYEKNGLTYFINCRDVAVIRAEGHYTILYSNNEKLFCSWSISEAIKRLSPGIFVRTHRSYLINPNHVSGFERKKDNGICYFENTPSVSKVPVSRSRLADVKSSLSLM